MAKILAFAGSMRKYAFSKAVVKAAASGAEAAGAEVSFIDLADFDIPIYNADQQESAGFPGDVLKLQDIISLHDAFLICTPEYNGSLPGGFKNVIDWVSRKSETHSMADLFVGKYAAIMSSSPGAFGGIRSLQHLRGVCTALGLHVLPKEIAVSLAAERIDGQNADVTDIRTRQNLEKLGESLVAAVS